MTISELTLETKEEEPVRRFEVFTGTGRHRDWSNEEKAQIVAESYSADVMVFAVARRHGLSPEQLFTRRRLLRKPGAVGRRGRSSRTTLWMCGYRAEQWWYSTQA